MDATTIHIAAFPPPCCASCYNQQPEMRHVDFGASFDGHVLNAPDVVANGATPIQVDDLIICEDCVRRAAEVVGMVDGDEPGQVESLEALVAETHLQLAAALDYADRLEAALTVRPEPTPPKPKPRAKAAANAN